MTVTEMIAILSEHPADAALEVRAVRTENGLTKMIMVAGGNGLDPVCQFYTDGKPEESPHRVCRV